MVETAVARTAATGPARPTEKPLLEIVGGPGRLGPESLQDLWQFREVLTAFVARQVKVRYKQAAIGVGWAVLQPVLAALLFALFLGRLAHVSSEGSPYLVFAMVGTVAWGFFSSAVSGAMESVVTDQALLRKVYFPREIFPFAAVLAALVDLAAASGTLLVALLAYGVHPGLAWLALPVPFLILVPAALAFGVGLSAVNVYYRDVRYVLPFVLQLGLFATPVVYSLSIVPGAWRTLYATLDPVAASIDALRRILLHDAWPAGTQTAASFAFSSLLLFGAYAFFKRLERGFSDRI